VIHERPASRARRLARQAPERGPAAVSAAEENARTEARSGLWRLVLAKVLGVVALLAVSGLLYDGAASPDFRVQQVAVSGARLLTAEEIADSAAVLGTNVFWLRRQEIRDRVRQLPAVRDVEVRVDLPGRVELRVQERSPYVSWQSGDSTFLVDSEGLVLSTREPEQPLVVVHDLDAPNLQAGARVSPGALRAVSKLSQLLPTELGLSPSEYDYSQALGVELQIPNGPRLRIGDGDDIETKLAIVKALREDLRRDGSVTQVIDVRYPSRPFYR
jgi:cell division protein FtsQ